MPARRTDGSNRKSNTTPPRKTTPSGIILGGHIRDERTARKLSQGELGKTVLGCTQGKINKIETGQSGVKQADLAKLVAFFALSEDRADEWRQLREQDYVGRRDSKQRAFVNSTSDDEVVPDRFRKFLELENRAEIEEAWHAESVPSLLQSEQYMVAQFETAGVAQDILEKRVAARIERQRILVRKPSPLFKILLGEGAFHRLPGGRNPTVLLDQMEHLLNLLDSGYRLIFNIVPFDAKLPHTPQDFTMMRFGDETPNFIYFEHPGGSITLDNVTQDVLDRYHRTWDELRGAALQPADTRKYLAEHVAKVRREILAG